MGAKIRAKWKITPDYLRIEIGEFYEKKGKANVVNHDLMFLSAEMWLILLMDCLDEKVL
jgi:hypothetical protein